jgi:hypothetical protein
MKKASRRNNVVKNVTKKNIKINNLIASSDNVRSLDWKNA